ncbi:TonB-dependent receptor [Lonsdalea quercina]|uniref:TonB-dependent receptor n=1 Tax=Lonsdalea quercina TaxID=71657 RepID=UPI0039757F03
MYNVKNTSTPLRKTLLALAVGSLAQTATAASTPIQADADAKTDSKDTIVVQASEAENFRPGGDALVPAYLEGQVANGGRLGMLGEQKAMDVPFNVVGYTAKMVQDKQAKTIAELLHSDAGVQTLQGYGNAAETYRIRGFKLDGDDMTMGGLAGVVPRQVVDTQMLDRVEVFKGANSLVNGAATSAVGGMINLEPKRAEDTPTTRVGVDYTSSSQVGGSLDLGRRFGDDNQFGVRMNVVHREGETAVDDDKRRTTMASLGLDYRGDRFRTSLDLGYQKKTFHGSEMGVNISGLDDVPAVPSNTRNYSQKWAYSDVSNKFGMIRAEYDLTDSWTTYAALGGQHANEMGTYSSPALTSSNGDATASRLDTNNIVDNFSGMAGLRGKFDTGFVSHRVNVGYSALTERTRTAWGMSFNNPTTNIYHNSDVPMPDNALWGGHYADPLTTSRSRMQGVLLSDTLGVLNDQLLFTVAGRHQKVVVRNYSNATGEEEADSRFTENRWMPTYGVVYKPWEQLSLYANHTESLQPGSIAPSTAANAGQSTGIIHSKQNEVGVKVDMGRVGGSMSLFEIKKPSAILDSVSNRYSVDGEQRNRGLELSVFGEPVLGVRLNASTVWLDPTLTKTADGANDGHDAIGVPRFYGVLGAEYDIKPVDGLTATAQLNHSGSQYANAENTKKLDSYTTLDLGLRYRTRVNNDQNEMVWRVALNNVTNEKYWSGVEDYGVYVFEGEPRTLKVSMSYDF